MRRLPSQGVKSLFCSPRHLSDAKWEELPQPLTPEAGVYP
jgi:hypothetical protein